ncbi:hypothetical protein [Labilibaculum manganireducens]|uniref:Bacteriocin n=1 Tax=Labilibaculum manganireducens TaxID=1940525 RepID=A0A2N3IEU8_9BACT|nr:hypothetical protein [Labilibaculum manganireducens]PKQ68830.1 hypothetical protein BZG01_03710 [Labilibaculum manganireducens]
MQNLVNIHGVKILSKVEQRKISGGQPVLKSCGPEGECPSGFCCRGGACIDDTPVNGTIPACDPM